MAELRKMLGKDKKKDKKGKKAKKEKKKKKVYMLYSYVNGDCNTW